MVAEIAFYLLICNKRLIIKAKRTRSSRTKQAGICGLRRGKGIRTEPEALALQEQQ